MEDPDPDDPVQKMIAEQNAKSQANREEIQREFEGKLFVKERADEARQYANSLFKAEKLEAAAVAYERILVFCDDQDKKKLRANLAAVRIKQWRWREALETCEIILADGSGDALEMKALYRKAQAYRGLRDAPAALATIAHARDVAAGKSTADLDTLEKHVTADIRRAEDATAEKRAKEDRMARRHAEWRAKEERQKLASMCGVALPPACDEEAGRERSWTSWLQREVVERLLSDDARLIIMEEDGWVHATEVPKIAVDAHIITGANGSRSLFYELDFSLACQCAQMRGTWDDPGCMSFEVDVCMHNVDNATTPDDWLVDAKLSNARSEDSATSRVKKMLEYVRSRYSPHVKQIVEKCVRRLERKVTESLADEAREAAAATATATEACAEAA